MWVFFEDVFNCLRQLTWGVVEGVFNDFVEFRGRYLQGMSLACVVRGFPGGYLRGLALGWLGRAFKDINGVFGDSRVLLSHVLGACLLGLGHASADVLGPGFRSTAANDRVQHVNAKSRRSARADPVQRLKSISWACRRRRCVSHMLPGNGTPRVAKEVATVAFSKQSAFGSVAIRLRSVVLGHCLR